MIVKIGKEKILSQSPVEIRDWGPWQFPRIFDGGGLIFLEFHVSADSAKAYGHPRKWLCTADNGETWTDCENGGLLLPGGDLVRPHQEKAVPEKDVFLPVKMGQFESYGFVRNYYDYKDIDPLYMHWYIQRKRPGGDWLVEETSVELPGWTMCTSEGVFPTGYFHHFKLDSEGAIWGLLYNHFINDGKISPYSASWYLKSTDSGKSFRFVGMVPYSYDAARDPGAAKRYGFGEPDICFLDGRTAFSLHRTTDGTGIGPMYITWTHDGGAAWTDPEFYDDRGVWPQTVRLGNGVVLAGYGRPGLFVRPYHEGIWHDRIAVVQPMEYQKDTCSYCALAAIGHDTALIVYSDFNYPGPDGIPRKSIMMRKIKVDA
ncbi:MAG: hypothetical protein R6W99_00280 [Clostridia bacterium]